MRVLKYEIDGVERKEITGAETRISISRNYSIHAFDFPRLVV